MSDQKTDSLHDVNRQQLDQLKQLSPATLTPGAIAAEAYRIGTTAGTPEADRVAALRLALDALRGA